MQKTFYVVVPFTSRETQAEGNSKKSSNLELTQEAFERAKNQLLQRVEFVMLGLRSCSLESVPLNTLEISELLSSLYHPLEAERGYYPEMPPELIE